MSWLRHALRHGGVLAIYVYRSGRWWLPLALLVWLVTAALVGTVHVVVPTSVYTLF